MVTQEIDKRGHHYKVVKESASITRHIWVYCDGEPYRHLIENSEGNLNVFSPTFTQGRMYELLTTFEDYKFR